MKKIRLLSFLLVILQVPYLWSFPAFAKELTVSVDSLLSNGLTYLEVKQNDDGSWGENKKTTTTNVANIIEFVSSYYCDEEVIASLEASSSYLFFEDWVNVDDISRCLLVDDLWDEV